MHFTKTRYPFLSNSLPSSQILYLGICAFFLLSIVNAEITHDVSVWEGGN